MRLFFKNLRFIAGIHSIKTGRPFFFLSFLLVIESGFLCTKSVAQCSSIDFKANVTKGCPLLIVRFSTIGTSSSAGTAFKWDFGKGFINGNDTITAAFSTSGQYTIKMQATLSGSGTPCSVIEKDTFITVLPIPVPVISVNTGLAKCYFKSGTKIILADSTSGSTSRTWIVNGKNSIDETDTITFTSGGTHPISLYSTNKYGCQGFASQELKLFDSLPVDICASFSVTKNTVSGVFTPEVGDTEGRTIAGYTWSFPGGSPSSSTAKYPPTVYYADPTKKYDVILSVSTSNGCSYTIHRKAFVSPFLTPAFQTECAAGFQVNVDLTDSNKSSWGFNFPNGTLTPTCQTCTIPPFILSYAVGGSYSGGVTYKYKNGLGCNIQVNYPFFVKAIGPRAGFTSTDNQICKSTDTVHFKNMSDTTNATNVKYTWYIFDSTDTKLLGSNNMVGPTSDYDALYEPGILGQFGVSLVATSLNGCRDSINKSQFITDPALPSPDFYVTAPAFYCAPAIATFINTTKNSGSASSYIWNFGDGTSLRVSDSSSVSHVYHHFNKAHYIVSLTAFTPRGCSQTLVKVNTINISGPVPMFTMDKRTGCDSLIVHFTDSSNNVRKFIFLYGDSSTPDTVSLAAHRYMLNNPNTDSIYFYPTLISLDDSFCPAFFKDTIKIYRICTSGIGSKDNNQFNFSVYPNPFSSSATVKYDLTKPSKITLSLFDLAGRQVETIINENQAPGAYQFDINAEKYRLIPGIYIMKFMENGYVVNRRLVKF